MRYVRRELERQVLRAVKGFPAIILTGPRRAGTTSLLRRLFPKAEEDRPPHNAQTSDRDQPDAALNAKKQVVSNQRDPNFRVTHVSPSILLRL